jgi:hypothetical protein
MRGLAWGAGFLLLLMLGPPSGGKSSSLRVSLEMLKQRREWVHFLFAKYSKRVPILVHCIVVTILHSISIKIFK